VTKQIKVLSLVLMLTGCSSPALMQDDDLPPEARTGCRLLAGLSLENAKLTAADLITDRPDLPDFCQVDGIIATRIGFTLRFPAGSWNRKFMVAGCGGFCGILLPEKPGHSNSINEALKLGFAAITTDGGHQAPSWDTDWAMKDTASLKLFAGAWMPLAVATGKQLLQQFYDVEPHRTYFSGCSNGGRLAMMAAQRYPTLFDAIAGGGSIFDLSGNAGIHGLWLLQSTRDRNGRAVIDQNKMPLLQSAVNSQCDQLDGVSDGVISRPESCQPRLDDLQCTSDEAIDCFTATELVSIKRLYQGASLGGVQLYPGIPPGSESLWSRWVVGTDDDPAWGERAATGNLRLIYGIPASQPFNAHDYDLAQELKNVRRLAPMLDATNPDLSGFAKAGGKFFHYHGLADPLILPGRTQQYYEEAVTALGKKRLDEFARFIMVPGHGHCWEKPGQVADEFNPLQIIDQWVESGQAPDHVTAVKKDTSGRLILSRKLCPLPKVAQLKGKDDSRAESYECVNP